MQHPLLAKRKGGTQSLREWSWSFPSKKNGKRKRTLTEKSHRTAFLFLFEQAAAAAANTTEKKYPIKEEER